jgi:hypothetical protein
MNPYLYFAAPWVIPALVCYSLTVSWLAVLP